MRYKGQQVAVLGAGLSGAAAARLLQDEGALVTVLDSAEEKKLLDSTLENLRSRGVTVICGPAADNHTSQYEFAVISPGIDPDSPLARNFYSRGIEIIGELELGWRSCESPVVAVTGTNGKTTTTELLAQMLNASGHRTVACGSIGKPLSDVARDREHYDVLVTEVSSFQLETIRGFQPQIAAMFAKLLRPFRRSVLGDYRNLLSILAVMRVPGDVARPRGLDAGQLRQAG